MGVAAVGGLFAVGIVAEGVGLQKDIEQMKEQARAVIATLRKAEEVVNNIANDVLNLMERTNYEHFINAAEASARSVFDPTVDTTDKLFAVCRAFDYTQITKLASTMEAYQICTRQTSGQ